MTWHKNTITQRHACCHCELFNCPTQCSHALALLSTLARCCGQDAHLATTNAHYRVTTIPRNIATSSPGWLPAHDSTQRPHWCRNKCANTDTSPIRCIISHGNGDRRNLQRNPRTRPTPGAHQLTRPEGTARKDTPVQNKPVDRWVSTVQPRYRQAALNSHHGVTFLMRYHTVRQPQATPPFSLSTIQANPGKSIPVQSVEYSNINLMKPIW